MIELIQGDCLVEMQAIQDQSIDMILCDLPYGMTACKWDAIIPFEPLWEQYKRIIKPHGAIVLFGSQPFTSALIMSNPKWFRYEWVWHKNRATGFLSAKKRPLRAHENILVFSSKATVYNPIMGNADPAKIRKRPGDRGNGRGSNPAIYGALLPNIYIDAGKRYPQTVLDIPAIYADHPDYYHPTQKPVPLCEYLIKTYTNEGETVLDNCMGSGTTGVACINTNRKFIGIELDAHYFAIAKERIERSQYNLFTLKQLHG